MGTVSSIKRSATDPISRRDGISHRPFDLIRLAQDAGLSPAQFAVLAVRIRHLGLEAPGITWTAPEEMHFCTGIKDPKTIRDADRALIAMGILTVAEEAGFYRCTRYFAHIDRLAEIAKARRDQFEAAKLPAKRNGRKAQTTGNFSPPFDGANDRGIFPKRPGKIPPELRTTSEDIQSSVSATHNAPPGAWPRDQAVKRKVRPSDKGDGAEAKQWHCLRTGMKVPREVAPRTWRMAVERMAPPGKAITPKAARSWLADAYVCIRAGRDADLVLANAARCGLARPDADRFPGWADELANQPPGAIAGTLAFRFGCFDQHVDALAASVRGLLAAGFALDGIEQIAVGVQEHVDAADRPTVDDPVGTLDRSVRRYFEPDPDGAEAFEASEEVGFETKKRFHPTYRGSGS